MATLSGRGPYGGLITDGVGNLYGTTIFGTVFRFDIGTGVATVLATFGGDPYLLGTLAIDPSGNLYGTTGFSGTSNCGTVFEVVSGSGAITTLANFNDTNGRYPCGGLVLDASGNLYGTTFIGGSSGNGTVFEVISGSGTIATLATFDGTNGTGPYGGMVRDSSGNLYGTTGYGGSSGYGTVFEVVSGSGTITTLASFDGTNGGRPQGNLLMDGSGNLYGTTFGSIVPYSLGTVFKVVAGSGTISTLATFTNANGGAPFGGLVMDPSGNLYGSTFIGGGGSAGTVFKIAAGSGALTTLVSFYDHVNGSLPIGNLVLDGSGNLFGVTAGSSQLPINPAIGNGTLFMVASGSGAITNLVSFTG